MLDDSFRFQRHDQKTVRAGIKSLNIYEAEIVVDCELYILTD